MARFAHVTRGRYALAFCAAALLAGSACGTAGAKAVKVQPAAPPQTITVTFHLQVSGVPATGTTFWVAYGPLGGRFGILQLHGLAGVYQTRYRLPAHGRTVFTYLAGRGVARARIGAVPGNPVVTIASIGPTTALEAGRRVVYWQAPAG